MRLNDTQSHLSYLRMSKERFEDLLTKVGPLLARRDDYWSRARANITPAERLAMTIRYLATGNSQISNPSTFVWGDQQFVALVQEACEALWNSLLRLYVKVPSTEEEWRSVSKQFEQM